MQPLFPWQTRTSTLMLFSHVQAAVWARLNLGSTRNRAKIWDARDNGPVLVSGWGDLRISSAVGFLLGAAQSHGRQSSFRFLSPGSGQRRARQDACQAGRCQVFRMTPPARVLSIFSWVWCPQGLPRSEPPLSPRGAVRGCPRTPGLPPLPTPLKLPCPMPPVISLSLPSDATLFGFIGAVGD